MEMERSEAVKRWEGESAREREEEEGGREERQRWEKIGREEMGGRRRREGREGRVIMDTASSLLLRLGTSELVLESEAVEVVRLMVVEAGGDGTPLPLPLPAAEKQQEEVRGKGMAMRKAES